MYLVFDNQYNKYIVIRQAVFPYCTTVSYTIIQMILKFICNVRIMLSL